MQQKQRKSYFKLAIILILPLFFVALAPHQSQAESHVLVRYFHGDVRCQTCLQFEDWAKTAAQSFPDELASGQLQWQLINFDLPENKHYIKDYNLVEKSLVLVKQENGKTIRWKNVEEFWDFGENQKQEFVSYVHNLIQDYLKN